MVPKIYMPSKPSLKYALAKNAVQTALPLPYASVDALTPTGKL